MAFGPNPREGSALPLGALATKVRVTQLLPYLTTTTLQLLPGILHAAHVPNPFSLHQ